MRKRIVSLLLSLVLVLNLVPTSVWAEELNNPDPPPIETTDTGTSASEGEGGSTEPPASADTPQDTDTPPEPDTLDPQDPTSSDTADTGNNSDNTGDAPDDTGTDPAPDNSPSTGGNDNDPSVPAADDTSTPPVSSDTAQTPSTTTPAPDTSSTPDVTDTTVELTEDFLSGADWESVPAVKHIPADRPMLFYAPSTTTAYINISKMNGYTNTATGQKMSWHFIDDGGYIQVAWCIQPNRSIVNDTDYSLSGALNNQTLRDVLQIAYEWGYWSNSNSFNATYIAATQVAVWWALGYSNASCNNSTVNSYATQLYNAALSDSGCGGGDLYGYTCTTNSSYQRLATYYPYRAPTVQYGDIRIQKSSSDPTLTTGNSNFSLSGAVYGIYASSSNATNNRYCLDTLTTSANGYSSYSDDLEVGYYYVKELTAPKGYQLDTSIYQVYVSANQTTLLQVQDEPAIQYGNIQLKKASANPEITNGNSCYSLAGAVYGIYSSRSNATNDRNRLGTLTTNANGVTGYSVDLEAGYNYYVKEITAPLGYALDSTVYTVGVSANNTSVLNVVDTPQSDPVGVLLKKVDATTGKGETCS